MPPLADGWILHCDTDVQGQTKGGRRSTRGLKRVEELHREEEGKETKLKQKGAP